MLTVDFDRLGLRPGDRVLDMGCGAGRHAFEMYRRGADVVAFDQDAEELAGVEELFAAMARGGRGAGRGRGRRQGGRRAAAALRRRRVRPGGARRGARAHPGRHRGHRRAGPGAAPRRHDRGHRAALAPEKVCWALSDAYHEVEGGHIRIYRPTSCSPSSCGPACVHDATTTRTRCTRPTGGSSAPSAWTTTDHPLVRAYHRLLVWDIVGAPGLSRLTRAGRARARPRHRQEHGALPAQARRRCRCPLPERPRAAPAILTADQVRRHRRLDRAVQEADGALPWAPGGAHRRWNHVEARWPWSSAASVEAAEPPTTGACATSARTAPGRSQVAGGVVDDAAARPTCRPTSRSASGTTGWSGATRRSWSGCGRRCASGLDFVVGLQLPLRRHRLVQSGRSGPARSTARRCWPAASSIHQSLRGRPRARGAARRPAAGLGAGRRPARPRRARAPRPGSSTSPTYSMDWYYPVLGGAVRGEARPPRCCATSAGTGSWSPGSGVRCVDTNPWVTGAETCELALALDAVGDRDAGPVAARGDAAPARRRTAATGPGYVFPDDGALAQRADDLHGGRGGAGRRRALGHHRRGRTSSVGRSLAGDGPRDRPGLRLLRRRARRRPDLSGRVAGARLPVAGDARAARPQGRLDSVKSPRERAPVDSYGGRPPSAGSGKTSWIDQHAAGRDPRRPAVVVVAARARRCARRRRRAAPAGCASARATDGGAADHRRRRRSSSPAS